MSTYKNFFSANITKNIKKFFGSYDKCNDGFIAGMLALYNVPSNPQGCETLEGLRQQIEAPDAAQVTIGGWHAMHFCLAAFNEEELSRYLEKAKATYSLDDWKQLSAPIMCTFGLYHALALNADQDAAIAAIDVLKNIEGVEPFAEGGFIGFTPAHLAVLNGSTRLAEKLRPLGEVEPGKERVTAFPLSSRTLERVLSTDEKWRSNARSSLTENRYINHAIAEGTILREALVHINQLELASRNKFKELMGENRIRKHSVFGGHNNRRPANWQEGLIAPMEPNLFSWTAFHLSVVRPDCTTEQLDTLLEEQSSVLLNKDAQGRSALFYACACASPEIIRWCIRNFREPDAKSMQERDNYQRSLLVALLHNQQEVVTAILPELLEGGVSLDADLFGWSPLFYALMMGHSQAACDIYQKMVDMAGPTLKDKEDFWERAKQLVREFSNDTVKSYLNSHRPQDNSWAQGMYGGLY